jgi:hypothetical protein
MHALAEIQWQVWFVVLWAVLFAYALGSRWRALKGTPGGVREPSRQDVVFDESYASARSHKSTYTRLGQATRCIHVSVTKSAVLIRPHFPVSLIGSDMDLVHDVPLTSISSVRLLSEQRVSAIAVEFSLPTGTRRVDLLLKRPAEFLAAVSRHIADRNRPNQPAEATPGDCPPATANPSSGAPQP